jgi:hypothetical protein
MAQETPFTIIREKNKAALALLAKGKLKESFDELLEAEISIIDFKHESQGSDCTTELASYRIITHNNFASWWRCKGDLGKALERLGFALQDGHDYPSVGSRQLATTHSNLCAVLSQVCDEHELLQQTNS